MTANKMVIRRGRSTVETRRGKPAIATLNEQSATGNLQTKIQILEGWVRDGIPLLRDEESTILIDEAGRNRLDFFPRTVRQFNFWDGTQNCATVRLGLAQFSVNANDTLRKRPDLRRAVEELICMLANAASTAIKTKREETIVGLRRSLELEELRRQQLEYELIRHRRELQDLAKENEFLRLQKDRISLASHDAIAKLECEIKLCRNASTSTKCEKCNITVFKRTLNNVTK